MKRFDRIEQIQPAAPEPSREPVDVEALARETAERIALKAWCMVNGADVFHEEIAVLEILAALRRVQPEKETP